jgi:hypothetical protein
VKKTANTIIATVATSLKIANDGSPMPLNGVAYSTVSWLGREDGFEVIPWRFRPLFFGQWSRAGFKTRGGKIAVGVSVRVIVETFIRRLAEARGQEGGRTRDALSNLDV